jgi:hypothetical protein
MLQFDVENKSVWEALKDTKDPIIMYGTGNGADKVFEVFKELISAQSSGAIAMDYLGVIASSEHLPYRLIVAELSNDGVSTEILSKIYRIEAVRTKAVPLVKDATEPVKQEFWKRRYERMY